IGLVLLAIGAVVYGVERLLGARAGQLPGDLVIRSDGWRIYAPLGTALLISLALTVLLNLIFWLWRR
ncbi:MAG: DUF2905 domain-containing protein, partial [Armatimonadetes bacterium]|nr:DUF2905 domain-containing protein [Armatimonadota bacterium]